MAYGQAQVQTIGDIADTFMQRFGPGAIANYMPMIYEMLLNSPYGQGAMRGARAQGATTYARTARGLERAGVGGSGAAAIARPAARSAGMGFEMNALAPIMQLAASISGQGVQTAATGTSYASQNVRFPDPNQRSLAMQMIGNLLAAGGVALPTLLNPAGGAATAAAGAGGWRGVPYR